MLVGADEFPDEAVWQAHQEAKAELLDTVEAAAGVRMDLETPVLGFARRMTGYKRPDLLFTDLERLAAIHREPSLPGGHRG